MGKWCWVLGVVMFGLSSAAAPASAEEPPLAFAGSGDLTTSCADLAAGKFKVAVRNETAVTQPVHLELQLSNENGRPLTLGEVCGGITWDAGAKTLSAGQVRAVAFAAEDDTDARGIAGSLVVYGDLGQVSRREVKIANASTSSHKLKVTPLVSSVNVDLHTSDRGPLWVPVEGSPPAPEGKGSAAVTVGSLSGPDGPVAVIYRGEAETLNEEASKVGLEIEGELEPGTYKGKVDLASEDEAGTVDIEVKVSKGWLLAAAIILAGILVGIWLLRASGRTLPGARLRGRVAGLSSRHEKIQNELRSSGDGSKSWTGFQVKDLAKVQADLNAQIDEATGKVLVQIEKSVVENIEAAIAAVEKQIDLLLEIPKHAQGLEAALQLPRPIHLPELSDTDRAQGKPLLELKAAVALAGGSVPAAAVAGVSEEMAAKGKQLAILRRFEKRLEELWLERQGLVGDLTELERRLTACRHLLWTVEDAEGLAEVPKRLEEVEEELVSARRKPSTQDQDLTMVQASALGAAKLEQMSGVEPAVIAATEAPLQPPPPPLTSGGATKAINKAFLAQIAVVLISAAVAVASGLGLLYVGKTWGTEWDLVAAFVWGIVAQATVTTLVSALDGARVLDVLRRQ